MDEMVYIAMTGAKQVEYAQAINTNNLANVSTTGFRADLHAFSSIPIEGPGVDARVNAVVDDYRTDFAQGAITTTGNDLDVALETPGFIAVQAPDGREAYTRTGALYISDGGLLYAGAGHLVMGEGGPVAVPPYASLTIGGDGTISIRPIGQGPETLTIVDRIKLVRPDHAEIEKREDGLFHRIDGGIEAPDASVTVQAGALEESNVNIARTLVNMIELARQYEMQVNVIKTAQENAEAAAQLMQVS